MSQSSVTLALGEGGNQETLTIVLYPRALELLAQFDQVEHEHRTKRLAVEQLQLDATEAYHAWEPLDRIYNQLLADVAAALGFGDLGHTSYSWRVREALKAYRAQKADDSTIEGMFDDSI